MNSQYLKRLDRAWQVLWHGLPEEPPQNESPVETPIDEGQEEVPESLTLPEPEPPQANLANGPYRKLVEDCADLLEEYEQMLPRMNETVRPFAENVVDRLQEILERNGVASIEDETSYDIIRHKVEPVKNVPQGAPILETLTPGLALQEKVLRRAKVRVEFTEDVKETKMR